VQLEAEFGNKVSNRIQTAHRNACSLL